MINEKEAYESIKELIQKYSSSPEQETKLLMSLKSNSFPPVRGIFSEISIDEEDSETLKDIFYYFG